MNSALQNLTQQEMEQNLSQRIQELYCNHLAHQPAEVSCKVFDNKVAIALANPMNHSIKLLTEQGQHHLAQQLWSGLDTTIQPKLKALIESLLGIPVIDWLTDTTIETGWTASIAVLDASPLFSDSAINAESRQGTEFADDAG